MASSSGSNHALPPSSWWIPSIYAEKFRPQPDDDVTHFESLLRISDYGPVSPQQTVLARDVEFVPNAVYNNVPITSCFRGYDPQPIVIVDDNDFEVSCSGAFPKEVEAFKINFYEALTVLSLRLDPVTDIAKFLNCSEMQEMFINCIETSGGNSMAKRLLKCIHIIRKGCGCISNYEICNLRKKFRGIQRFLAWRSKLLHDS